MASQRRKPHHAAMAETHEFLLRYGYLLVVGTVFLDQLGAPIPAAPVLLAAGAVAGLGHLAFAWILVLGTVATLVADLIWYEVGRRNGMRVLQILCRISLEPDSCIRRTEDTFTRHGARSLLVAKFVPGLSTVAPPLAGIFGMGRMKFFTFSAAGAVGWIVTYVGIGYVFSDQLEEVAAKLARFGSSAVVLGAAALALWIAWKFVARRRFIRKLRTDRITPDELKQKLDRGEEVLVVDLRGDLDYEADRQTIPGALRVAASRVDEIREQLASAAEVILYCT